MNYPCKTSQKGSLDRLGNINSTSLTPSYSSLVNNNCLLSKEAWKTVRCIFNPPVSYSFYILIETQRLLKTGEVPAGKLIFSLLFYYYEIWISRCDLHFTFTLPHTEMSDAVGFLEAVFFLSFSISRHLVIAEIRPTDLQMGYHFCLHCSCASFLLQNRCIFCSACHMYFLCQSGWFSQKKAK